MTKQIVNFIREIYKSNGSIPLHTPNFFGNEMKYVSETIESNFVSSVGQFVNDFESEMEKFTGSPKAVAVVNGTAALHTAMYMMGVKAGDFVITQALTFVATCNAVYHIGAEPILLDVSKKSLSLCPVALDSFLSEHAVLKDEGCFHKTSLRKIGAVVPMHTFGHPAMLDELLEVCNRWNLPMIEDAAESLGSFYKNRHTGTFGQMGAISFNGNKIITTGGGGMVLCANKEIGSKTKHITTTAKVPHPYEYFHNEPGFNFRLPNINAALGCAQMEALETFIAQKRALASCYENFFANTEYLFVKEPDYAKSNYWLNAVICQNKDARDDLLLKTNKEDVMTRPLWKLMNNLPMFKNVICDDLLVSKWLEERVVNLPSSPVELF